MCAPKSPSVDFYASVTLAFLMSPLLVVSRAPTHLRHLRPSLAQLLPPSLLYYMQYCQRHDPHPWLNSHHVCTPGSCLLDCLLATPLAPYSWPPLPLGPHHFILSLTCAFTISCPDNVLLPPRDPLRHSL